MLKNCRNSTVQVSQLSICRATLSIKVRFLVNNIFEIFPWVEWRTFKLKAYCPVYDLFFQFSLRSDVPFLFWFQVRSLGRLSNGILFSKIWNAYAFTEMAVVNENVEEYILNFSTIIEFQSWKASATISAWCVHILQSWGLKGLSLMRGLPRASDMMFKKSYHFSNLKFIFYKMRGVPLGNFWRYSHFLSL